MTSYEKFLAAVVRYFDENGTTQESCDTVEAMLPGAWAMELIADALDIISSR